VLVVVPEDVAAGDTFSATMSAYPKDGQDLSRYSVRIGDITTPVQAGVVVLTLPGAGQSGPGDVSIALLDETGAEVGRTGFRVPAARPASTGSTILPKNGNPGQPVVVRGRFDGNTGTTRVLVGGTPVPILAESPRTLVLLGPPASNEKTEIEVREGDQTLRGEFRSEKPRRRGPWGKYVLIALGITAVAIAIFFIQLADSFGDGFRFPG
jgi:hypothetical protein